MEDKYPNDMPRPIAFQNKGHRIIPIFEESAFGKYHSPKEIQDLILEIIGEASKGRLSDNFSPERIKEVIEYAKPHFKDITTSIHFREYVCRYPNKEFNEVYCFSVQSNPFDGRVIANAHINFLGISLVKDFVIKEENLEAMTEKAETFNLTKKRYFHPVVEVSKDKKVIFPREFFKTYNIHFAQKVKDYDGYYLREIGLKRNFIHSYSRDSYLISFMRGEITRNINIKDIEDIKTINVLDDEKNHILYQCIPERNQKNISFQNLGPRDMPLFFIRLTGDCNIEH